MEAKKGLNLNAYVIRVLAEQYFNGTITGLHQKYADEAFSPFKVFCTGNTRLSFWCWVKIGGYVWAEYKWNKASGCWEKDWHTNTKNQKKFARKATPISWWNCENQFYKMESKVDVAEIFEQLLVYVLPTLDVFAFDDYGAMDEKPKLDFDFLEELQKI